MILLKIFCIPLAEELMGFFCGGLNVFFNKKILSAEKSHDTNAIKNITLNGNRNQFSRRRNH
jgi:hypothetical protein